MSDARTAREAIFSAVRRAVAADAGSPLTPPASARFEPRTAASLEEEIERMVAETGKVSGHTARVRGAADFAAALEKLVREEGVKTATLTDHPLHERYGTRALLAEMGIGLLAPEGVGKNLAECDLGIAVADAGLPDTGTILLRTTQGQADALSLVPRVSLALLEPAALAADFDQAFELAGGDRHFELVTGCSRTADIEKVLILGVHGPKSYHLWVCG